MTKYNHLTSLNQIDPFPTKLGNKIEQPVKPKTQFHHGQKLKEGFFLTDGKLGYAPTLDHNLEEIKKKIIAAGTSTHWLPERKLLLNDSVRYCINDSPDIENKNPTNTLIDNSACVTEMINEDKTNPWRCSLHSLITKPQPTVQESSIDKFYRELEETGFIDHSYLRDNLISVINDQRYLFTSSKLMATIFYLKLSSLTGFNITESIKDQAYSEMMSDVNYITNLNTGQNITQMVPNLPWIPKASYNSAFSFLKRVMLPWIVNKCDKSFFGKLLNLPNVNEDFKDLMTKCLKEKEKLELQTMAELELRINQALEN